jgi:outer membrane biosynthesis protein TonB
MSWRERLFPVLLAASGGSAVQAAPYETLRQSGDPSNRVDLVIVAEGYTASQVSKFRSDATAFMTGVFAQEPYARYQGYYNVYLLLTTSAQSGADHPERGVYVDTAFDATYNCAGTQRLICVDTGKVDAAVNASLPSSAYRDQMFVLVNDDEYGGSGGYLAVGSVHEAVVELFLHEVGHSFALLADEYSYDSQLCTISEPQAANATTQTSRDGIKWARWIDATTAVPTTGSTGGVAGLYEGARYCPSGMYRPTYDSKMRSLYRPFEQINTEAHVLRIHDWVSPIDAVQPPGPGVTIAPGQTTTFRVTTPAPVGLALAIRWYLDGQSAGTGAAFSSTGIPPGTHSLQVVVSDETTMVRNDPQQLLVDDRTWSVVQNGGVTPTPTATATATASPTPTPTPTPTASPSPRPTATPSPSPSPTPTATPSPTPTPRPTATPNVQTVTENPRIGVANVSLMEGDTGSSSATFTVTLSSASTQAVSVLYTTADGTATAGSDYAAASGVLTFGIGETSKPIVVSVLGDTARESNEAFAVNLTSPEGATLARSSAQCTILNDDDQAAGAVARPQPSWQDFFAVDSLETPYVGDFDGDGRVDIVTFTRQNPAAFGDVYVALSSGVRFGDNVKWHDFFAIDNREKVLIGDYDGDGKDDVATWLASSTHQVYVARSVGTGMTQALPWLDGIGGDPGDVLLTGDADGDGKNDLILFARSQGKVYVARSTGSAFTRPALWHSFFAVSTYERPRVADVTGDGKADIVTFATDSPTAFGDVYVAASDGSQFVDLAGTPGGASKWHDFFAIRPTEEIRIGDLDGDGKADFYTFLPPPFAQCYTALSKGTSMGDNVLWPEAVAPRLGGGDNVYVGDVNGDRKADVVIFAQGEGKVHVSLAP